MSYDIGLACLNLKSPPRLGHTEYCSNDALLRAVAKAQPGLSFTQAWDFDIAWATHDGPVPWNQRGRTTDMGHAEFLEGGVDFRQPKHSPFEDAEQVLAFDAVAEYGLPDFDDLVRFYAEFRAGAQAANPWLVFPGGYYKTIVSGAIEAFGWDMLLEAAADREGFARVIDSIFRLSLHHYRAWSKVDMDFFISHDDMVWTSGPFMSPDFYRAEIFPRYAELWKPLKDKGVKILYCSDGDYTMFLDDLAQAGADGFIFEPLTNLDTVIRKFASTHVIVGSKVDCRTLTFGEPAAIRDEIDRTLAVAFDCPGFIFAVGNHIPSNIPVDNALAYFDHLSRSWHRRGATVR